MEENDIVGMEYGDIQSFDISDHKPVYGIYKIKIKKLINEKFKNVYDEILKIIGKKLNN
jgi:hypothetical protein